MLEKINSPHDIKGLSIEQLNSLCNEIRAAILNRVSKLGGHVGGNLGNVESVVAIHYVFNSPTDKIVFDVSHQCYTHKILTGRKFGFIDDKRLLEISGYTNPEESEHDQFFVGHTSTSISLALGLCKGRDTVGDKHNVIAFIGDGSLSGGEALEGLDYAGEYANNLIIVVNDNGMSIAENHGGLYKNLNDLRITKGKSENNIFKAFGLDYIFVEKGNDLNSLINAFNQVKGCLKPTVVHICTQKGKGYEPAEENKERFHWHLPFDKNSGKPVNAGSLRYVEFVRDYLINKVKENKKVRIVCAATPGAIGFTPEYRALLNDSFTDVAITEENAVAIISGMAKAGAKPIFCVQSSFIQRCYDQLSQDLSLNKSAAVIFIYSSGLSALTDVTHLGIFDMAMMGSIPNLLCLSPIDTHEFTDMADWALKQNERPVVIRIPAGAPRQFGCSFGGYNGENSGNIIQMGEKVAIFALGNHFEIGLKTCHKLYQKGINATLINARCSNEVDNEQIERICKTHRLLVTIEDGVLDGGYGQKICSSAARFGVTVLNYGYKKQFIDRYDPKKMLIESGIEDGLIAAEILKKLG